MRICKECGKRVPEGKSLNSLAARTLRLCRYCYRWRFPRRKNPVRKAWQEWLLGWSTRRELERAGFNPEEWSPEFRREMLDYWRARDRGEVNI